MEAESGAGILLLAASACRTGCQCNLVAVWAWHTDYAYLQLHLVQTLEKW